MMNLLPLTAVIFSLLAGGTSDGQTSDTKGDILGRYLGNEVEESQDDNTLPQEEGAEEELS